MQYFESYDESPALEAILYGNIKLNYCMKQQDHLRMPKGKGNEVILLSPNANASYRIIDNGYPTFKKDGFFAYVTDTRIARTINLKMIRENGISTYRPNYLKNVSDGAIKFYSTANLNPVTETSKPFIYDTGRMHELYFQNRSTTKGPAFACSDYMNLLFDLIDGCAENYKKILYISIDEWATIGAKFGILTSMLNNPISIILRCMLKYPEYIVNLAIRDCTLLIVNEPHKEFIKLEFTTDLIDDNNKPNLDKIVKIYQKFRTQLSKMTVTNISNTLITDEDTDSEIAPLNSKAPENFDSMKSILVNEKAVSKLPPNTAMAKKLCPVAEEMKRNLTGSNNMEDITPISISIENELEEDAEISASSQISENIDEVNEEIKDVIDDAVNTIPELTDDEVSDDDKKKIIEDNVKKKVYLAKFIPEHTKKQLEYIDVGYAKQSKVLSQPIEQMKAKIIDETEVGNIVNSNNENIKHIKYGNADKSYVEKKYRIDIDNAVAKLSDADTKMFIESIEEEDTSDQLNQKKTLTYHIIDENGKKHTLVFDVPIIYDGCHMYLGGANKILLHQRIFKPITKIRENMVQIVSYYNKVTVVRYGTSTNELTAALKKYFTKHAEKYRVRFGNARANNLKYKTSMEFDDFARTFTTLTFKDEKGDTYVVDFDLSRAEQTYLSSKELKADKDAFKRSSFYNVIVTNSHGEKYFTDMNNGEVSNFLYNHLSQKDRNEISKYKGSGKRYAHCRANILNKSIPVALFCLFCEGFESVMHKCDIRYTFLPTLAEYNKIKTYTSDMIRVADGIIAYEQDTVAKSLFMNGLKGIGLDAYTFEELESKDTYIDIMTSFYASANQAFNLDQFRMFLIDNKTKEILEDFDLPTDLIEVMFYTCELLVNNQCSNDGDMRQVRIRSAEIVSQLAYQTVVAAYSRYRKLLNSSKPARLSVPRDEVIKALLASSLCDEDSVVNPVYQLEKTRAVTIGGAVSDKFKTSHTLTGVNMVENYTMDKRAYDESMVGIFGLTTPADKNTGLIRDLSLEPTITSTNGYIDVTGIENVDSLNSANLFTAVELLTPPGVLHDDPQRSAMMRGQTSKMVMTDGSSPVLIGNRVESVIPYHMNNDYCFTAKDKGKVIDESHGVYVVQYKNGKYDSFDTNEIMRKNSSDGSYTRIKFETKVKVGDSFDKNEILAVAPNAFTFNYYDKGASCNIGVLAKVAITSLWDTFEDSEPMTRALSNKLGFYAIKKKVVSLEAPTYVEKMVKIGDHVNIGDALITFDNSRGDPEVQKYLDSLRKGQIDQGIVEELIEANNTIAKAPTTGEITKIIISTTVPVEELSPSLQKIVKAYHAEVVKKEKFLDKYKNPEDNRYYKCGQLLTETADVVETKYGKVKGENVGDGVIIEFFIRHHDVVKKGDKSTNFIAAKGVNSHIIPDGMEPWSEDRPEEEVSAFITPISTPARKIPSIYIAGFGNKVLIEAKRQMTDKYLRGRGLIK